MTAPSVERLPSGRSSSKTLARQDVVKHQRDRILHAMATTVADTGYTHATVTRVITLAGVSRATFYQQFTNTRDCFLATFDLAVDLLVDAMVDETPGDLAGLIGLYLHRIVDQQTLARVLLLDIQSLGVEGVIRRSQSNERIRDRLADAVGARTEADRFACEAFVAAVGSLITVQLAHRDADAIMALHGPLTDIAERLFGQSRLK
ncbi:MAG: TetR/AcrR family transcriptional regulator [Actinomycetota bacterium]|nr:TetR/AcrR family transcriptional regulator [Actinomycetota bacterium]